MRALGITVMEMRPHDPQGQVLLDSLVELRAPEPATERSFARDQEGATQEGPHRRARDREAGRVANGFRQGELRKRPEFRGRDVAYERDVLRGKSATVARSIRDGPQRIEDGLALCFSRAQEGLHRRGHRATATMLRVRHVPASAFLERRARRHRMLGVPVGVQLHGAQYPRASRAASTPLPGGSGNPRMRPFAAAAHQPEGRFDMNAPKLVLLAATLTAIASCTHTNATTSASQAAGTAASVGPTATPPRDPKLPPSEETAK